MASTLCLVFQKDRVGACVWRDELESLETCEFWDHGPLEPPSLSELYSVVENAVSLGGESYPAIQTLLRQVRPSILVVSSSSPDSLISLLQSYVSAQNELLRTWPLTLDSLVFKRIDSADWALANDFNLQQRRVTSRLSPPATFPTIKRVTSSLLFFCLNWPTTIVAD